jgi:hypothetical protein
MKLECYAVERHGRIGRVQKLDELVARVGAGMVVIELVDDDARVDNMRKTKNGEE